MMSSVMRWPFSLLRSDIVLLIRTTKCPAVFVPAEDRPDFTYPASQGRIGLASAPHMCRLLTTPKGLAPVNPPAENKAEYF